MSFCQSVRYALGIYAICFLLNGISSAEDSVREQYAAASSPSTKATIEPEGRALFNPRVDYNQWTPVGHADPLKNDPTFDYVPPTSVSVRYWSESSEGKSNNDNAAANNTVDKSEILLLGAPVEHSVHVQSNHLRQPEVKSANRRSSPYFPPEPSRVLTPPSMQAYMSSYDQSAHPSEYNYYATPPSNYWNNDLPVSHSSDAYPDESASYVTVIRPKTNPHPYSSTIYNKNVRNSIYHLAANVNSLEIEKRPHWVQSLLQKEVTYQPPSTTPSVVFAYSPHIYEPQSTNLNIKVEAPPKDTLSIEHSFAEPTTATPTPTIMTTDSLFSHYNQPALPVRGPMYLIIQGHSKVKTYGADQYDKKPEKHEPKMVPVTVKDDLIVKHLVSTDQNGNEFQVKHLHKLHTPEVKTKTSSTKTTKKPSNSPMMDSLLSLLDTSWANFGMNNNKDDKTKSNDLKKTTERTASSITKISSIMGPTTIRPNSSS
ncbi:uncharacterized protein LOC129566954 [Sitodiplosis mosellana]|uniref:uncharacterized protein LOC129566954 n=1 Tax=Sitodiplosis mosellana TaxID=263140 RepID=UPI002444E696|nr:uncharacterized protein LOC129566954 [Sitodiplosis mosellana]XP_055299339.1 uncharacterized protein LOC129566954 [Sitodiplosis mosellana]XP_055299340.1 uncharacterized protein LOC129566954 [Sitodiplosis mosellana]XP_055299341.1 uncharacterized protein LOC129566954 [Sitodiplosis mosellana]